MQTAQIEIIVQLGGQSRRAVINREADGSTPRTPTLDPAVAAETWTKTDANTGTALLPDGHGFSNGDKVAVFWADGFRYNLDATLTGNSAVLDGGAGSDLPASGTAVIVAKRQPVRVNSVGNEIEAFTIDGTARVLVVLHDVAELPAADPLDLAAGELCLWFKGCGLPNPLKDKTVTGAWLFNGATVVNPCTLQFLEDTTP